MRMGAPFLSGSTTRFLATMVPSPKPTEAWSERMTSSSIATSAAKLVDQAVGVELDALPADFAAQPRAAWPFAVAAFEVRPSDSPGAGKRTKRLTSPSGTRACTLPRIRGFASRADRRLNVAEARARRAADRSTRDVASGTRCPALRRRRRTAASASRRTRTDASAEPEASIELAEHVFVDGRRAASSGSARAPRVRARSTARPRRRATSKPGPSSAVTSTSMSRPCQTTPSMSRSMAASVMATEVNGACRMGAMAVRLRQAVAARSRARRRAPRPGPAGRRSRCGRRRADRPSAKQSAAEPRCAPR